MRPTWPHVLILYAGVCLTLVCVLLIATGCNKEASTARKMNELCKSHDGLSNAKLENDGRSGGLAICRDGFAAWVNP